MTTQEEDTFVACTCPHCEKPLDETPTSSKYCPHCRERLDPHDVWLTRKYEGVVILPPWVKAFGWPFLIMIFAVVWFVVLLLEYQELEFKVSGIAFSVGLIFFLFKLHDNNKW